LSVHFPDDPFNPIPDAVRFCIRELSNPFDRGVNLSLERYSPSASYRLYPSNAGRKGTFADDVKTTNLTGVANMGPTAQFSAKFADGDYPDLVTLLLFKKGCGTLTDGIFSLPLLG
jgi:hypothetical protein